MNANLIEGMRIVTSDGEKLGTVKEIRGDAFKVDAPMMPDYWLGCDTIVTEQGDALRLAFPKEAVDQYRRPEPSHV